MSIVKIITRHIALSKWGIIVPYMHHTIFKKAALAPNSPIRMGSHDVLIFTRKYPRSIDDIPIVIFEHNVFIFMYAGSRFEPGSSISIPHLNINKIHAVNVSMIGTCMTLGRHCSMAFILE